MKLLNLGCGTKTSSHMDVVNIDFSISVRLKKNRILRPLLSLLVTGDRFDRIISLPDNIIVHNLAKGIPFPSSSVDVVYHSHLLEHLDKDVAVKFLLEIKRVLRPNGILRIVVPDFEKMCRAYITHISECESNPNESDAHDAYISSIILQMVRREAFGSSQQRPLRRFIENVLLGDARKRGETHQWMYDRINLSELLISLGYKNPASQKYNTSLISGWNQYGLDMNEDDSEYKIESMYMEAQK